MVQSLRFSAVKKLVFPESVPKEKREYFANTICSNITLNDFNMRRDGYQAVAVENSKGDYILLIDDKTDKDATRYIDAKNDSFKKHYTETNKDGYRTVVEKKLGQSGSVYRKAVKDIIDKLSKKAFDVEVKVKSINPFECELSSQI